MSIPARVGYHIMIAMIFSGIVQSKFQFYCLLPRALGWWWSFVGVRDQLKGDLKTAHNNLKSAMEDRQLYGGLYS